MDHLFSLIHIYICMWLGTDAKLNSNPRCIQFLEFVRMHLANVVRDGHDDCADGSAFIHQLQTSRKSRGRRGERGNDSFHGLECLSPRLMLSKLLRRRRKQRELAKVEGETRDEEFEEVSKLDLELARDKSQIRCLPEDSNKELDSIEVAGQYGKETCFNLAVGLGLLHLLSLSKTELTKMVELRTQMELLFQNVKDEPRQKNIIFTNPSESKTTTGKAIPLHSTVDSEKSVSYEQSVALEAELKAEMELLQLHLNGEETSEYTKQQSMEMSFGDTAPEEESIMSVSFGGVVDHHPEVSSDVSFAVCPVELERRLHMLIEIRHKERIQDLEDALESAKKKISEREKEIYRWKYAARFVSRRIPDSQSFSR